MNINRKWASGIGADGNPVYAPNDAIVIDGRTVLGPKDKHYEAAGYLPVLDELPDVPAPEGYHWEKRGWSIHDGDVKRIIRDVEAVPNPPPAPRVFSCLYLEAALPETTDFTSTAVQARSQSAPTSNPLAICERKEK